MSNVLVEEGTMTEIGNAIREKAGSETKFYPREMPDAIREISGGGNDSEDKPPFGLTIEEHWDQIFQSWADIKVMKANSAFDEAKREAESGKINCAVSYTMVKNTKSELERYLKDSDFKYFTLRSSNHKIKTFEFEFGIMDAEGNFKSFDNPVKGSYDWPSTNNLTVSWDTNSIVDQLALAPDGQYYFIMKILTSNDETKESNYPLHLFFPAFLSTPIFYIGGVYISGYETTSYNSDFSVSLTENLGWIVQFNNAVKGISIKARDKTGRILCTENNFYRSPSDASFCEILNHNFCRYGGAGSSYSNLDTYTISKQPNLKAGRQYTCFDYYEPTSPRTTYFYPKNLDLRIFTRS